MERSVALPENLLLPVRTQVSRELRIEEIRQVMKACRADVGEVIHLAAGYLAAKGHFDLAAGARRIGTEIQRLEFEVTHTREGT